MFLIEIQEVIINPNPTPIKIEAAIKMGDEWTKINPIPTPIMVEPPIAHMLLSSFLDVMIIYLYMGKVTQQHQDPNDKDHLKNDQLANLNSAF